MKTLKLSKRFVSSWLLGTAIFVCGWSWYLSYANSASAWLFVGWMGGSVMLHLHAKVEGIDTSKTDQFFWVFLVTLLVVAIGIALTSLGIGDDVFGLLGGKG